ncbi:hypothetical protein PFISCL1PPCAC_4025 [Pristionchus fissidentatus]|uniref:Uncharacterized protein n=1 Tax=Pristionchus fissidentatus TaxID=1538716 RepID=A0AAV5V2V5_9BILA|nr:hypothetical protein PFISCL1PPCAC_4025 [Pristionchus fissidentatus]
MALPGFDAAVHTPLRGQSAQDAVCYAVIMCTGNFTSKTLAQVINDPCCSSQCRHALSIDAIAKFRAEVLQAVHGALTRASIHSLLHYLLSLTTIVPPSRETNAVLVDTYIAGVKLCKPKFLDEHSLASPKRSTMNTFGSL